MMIYIIEFIIILILASRIKDQSCKKNIFLLILIIFISSLIGGARDFSIGTDVEVYGKRWFEIAINCSNFKTFASIIGSVDYGYLLLNYFVSRFTDNVNAFLFILQLICNSLVFLTFYKYREKCDFWRSSLIYLCAFYCMSFNIMRQACALSIMLFCLKYLDNGSILKYILGVLLAMSFHNTAILSGILILLIYSISKIKNRFQFFIVLFLIMITSLSIFFIKDFIELGYRLGIFNYRIYDYIIRFSKENISVSVVELIIKIFIFLVCIIQSKIINNRASINKFLFISVILEFILFQSKILISYSDRFSYYFGYLNMVYIPQSFKSLASNKKNAFIFNLIFILIFFSYWYYKYIICGHCEVFPYKSSVLGI